MGTMAATKNEELEDPFKDYKDYPAYFAVPDILVYHERITLDRPRAWI
jgi:hypothetical protein